MKREVHVSLMIDQAMHEAIMALAAHQEISYGEALIAALVTGLAAKETAQKPAKSDSAKP